MNSIIDNKRDNHIFWREEKERCINSQSYFYDNYVVVNGKKSIMFDIDKALFKTINEAFKEGKNLMLLKR